MTREDAIHIVDVAFNIPLSVRRSGEYRTYHEAEIREAKRMAIKELEQEPCEDAISRQAAIDAIWDGVNMDIYTREVKECLEKLPSVNAEKTGLWITQWNPVHQKEYYYCSECREEYSYDGETGIKMNNYKYCPNCGAKMEVEE